MMMQIITKQETESQEFIGRLRMVTKAHMDRAHGLSHEHRFVQRANRWMWLLLTEKEEHNKKFNRNAQKTYCNNPASAFYGGVNLSGRNEQITLLP